MTQAEYFGLHDVDGVKWLVQGRSGTNFIGLKSTCPLEGPKRQMCNHLMAPSAPIPDKIQWHQFMKVFHDPLVQAMLPIPRPVGDRLFFLDDAHDNLAVHLMNLSRMSSPVVSPVRPLWMVKPSEIQSRMANTNIQPWILTQASLKDMEYLEQLAAASAYFPRTVIVTGRKDIPIPPGFKELTTDITSFPLEDLVMMPLENLGATLLRRHTRGEELGAPIESREERRQRIRGGA